MAFENLIEGGANISQAWGCTSLEVEGYCPGTGCAHFHSGVDLARAGICGAQTYAVGYGRVVRVGADPGSYISGCCSDGGCGGPFAVTIESGDYWIRYYHVMAALVEVGDAVYPGLAVARVGTRGCSFGCHLHFEVDPRGMPAGCASVDPMPFTQSWTGAEPIIVPPPLGPAPIQPQPLPPRSGPAEVNAAGNGLAIAALAVGAAFVAHEVHRRGMLGGK